MLDFKDKVALITGGTRGLGRAIALTLARGGATIALNYRRDEESAQRTLDEVREVSPRSILVKADMEEDAQAARWSRVRRSRSGAWISSW